MNERQQLTLEYIATRIEWLRLLAPELQGLRRRDMIDKYGFPVLREIENVEEFGCRLKFVNFYGTAPDRDSDRMRFRRDTDALERAGLLVITYDGRLRFGRPSGVTPVSV